MKDYVNKTIKHFDELSVIPGDDAAIGEFKRSVYERFGATPNRDRAPIEEEIEPLDELF